MVEMNETVAILELVERTSDGLAFFEVQSPRRLVAQMLNPAAGRLFGLEPGCAIGKTPHELFPAEMADGLMRGCQLCLDTTAPITTEHGCTLLGKPRWFQAVVVPLGPTGLPLQRLAVTWRDMTSQKVFERALCDSEEMFRRLVESTGVVPWEADLRTQRFTYVGPQAVRLFGYPQAEWYQDGFWPRILHPDDRDQTLDSWLSLPHSRSEYELEYRVLTRTGEVVWVHDLVSAVLDPQGQIMLRGFLVDVTDRRKAEEEVRRLNNELERRVAERTRQLAAANRELEAFCYSVSHDLRAPLRAIDGFSKALMEDYLDRLDADGQDMLRRVRSASQRMGELIDDLLTLSRVARTTMHTARVDLSEMARAVTVALHNQTPGRRVEWHIEPDLFAVGDPALLRVVLDNLLGNAFKYTSRHLEARICFGRRIEEGEPVFFIGDDGAGFDPAYAGKLFQPFQRLHRPDEFEGHGVGLATVQRIIHRHGGRVWATGAVERGATFYFTL
jgi:PAS domain S-box-containing protein